MNQAETVANEASEIDVFTSPWVSGTRAAAYFGPLLYESVFKDFSEDFPKAIQAFKLKAMLLGANSIVGVEIIVDPYSEPTTIKLIGTAAKLEPLF